MKVEFIRPDYMDNSDTKAVAVINKRWLVFLGERPDHPSAWKIYHNDRKDRILRGDAHAGLKVTQKIRCKHCKVVASKEEAAMIRLLLEADWSNE